jgi:hypothetical protein
MKTVLRSIYKPKREEVTGTQRKLHNKELHNLYTLHKIAVIKLRIRWVGYVACPWKIVEIPWEVYGENMDSVGCGLVSVGKV